LKTPDGVRGLGAGAGSDDVDVEGAGAGAEDVDVDGAVVAVVAAGAVVSAVAVGVGVISAGGAGVGVVDGAGVGVVDGAGVGVVHGVGVGVVDGVGVGFAGGAGAGAGASRSRRRWMTNAWCLMTTSWCLVVTRIASKILAKPLNTVFTSPLYACSCCSTALLLQSQAGAAAAFLFVPRLPAPLNNESMLALMPAGALEIWIEITHYIQPLGDIVSVISAIWRSSQLNLDIVSIAKSPSQKRGNRLNCQDLQVFQKISKSFRR
jgi:hypothetical protein